MLIDSSFRITSENALNADTILSKELLKTPYLNIIKIFQFYLICFNSPHDVLTMDKIEKILIGLGVDFEEIYYVFETKYFSIGNKTKSSILDLIDSHKVCMFAWIYSQDSAPSKWDIWWLEYFYNCFFILLEYLWSVLKVTSYKTNDKGADHDLFYNDCSGVTDIKQLATPSNVFILLSYLFAGWILPLLYIYAHSLEEPEFKEFYYDCIK